MKSPEIWHRLRLTLRWLVYEDRQGNLIVVSPDRPKPLGTPTAMKRPKTIYLAATDQELESALEELLYVYERSTRVNSRHLSLVERVQEARDRRHGRSPKSRAA